MKKIITTQILFGLLIGLLCPFAPLMADQVKALASEKKMPLGIAYEVTIHLSQNEQDLSSLEDLLLQVSEAHRLENKPPMSLLILNRRAESDIKALQKALRSRAYYHADITYKINKIAKPVELNYTVNTGVKYLFNKITIQLADKLSVSKLLKLPLAEDIGFKKQIAADARTVLLAEKKLIFQLKKQSFAYAKLVNKKFTVDHKNRTMDVHFEVAPGPSIRFGSTKFIGMKTVDSTFLQSLISWKINDLYHPSLLKETTSNVAERDLFSTIRIELVKPENLKKSKLSKKQTNKLAEATVPVHIHLKERLHRSIKAHVGFDTDTGFTIGGKWTHRNYFGAGEKLSVEAAWTGVGPLVDVRFNKPSFYHPKQSFLANIKLQNEDTDAYESSSLSMGGAIERTFLKNMKLSLGLAFKQSSVTDKSVDVDSLSVDSSQNFSLFYMPLKFTWDYSNDLFEPDGGGKILVQGAPFMDVQSDLMFTKIFASYIHYLKVMSQPKLVLAGRVALGQITGADAYELPADERFYSGGGGSVRGYAYQLIGPLDKNNNPLGGNALLEFALESRINFTQTIGGVIFVDGGSAYSSSFFDGSSDLLYGAGVGVRYSSPMGPLRADVAIPVNRRDGVDDAFQIYLSIGQAF